MDMVTRSGFIIRFFPMSFLKSLTAKDPNNAVFGSLLFIKYKYYTDKLMTDIVTASLLPVIKLIMIICIYDHSFSM